MTKPRFSSRMLDELRSTYRQRINASKDYSERILRNKREKAKENIQSDMIDAIITAAKNAGAETVSIVDADCYSEYISLRIQCRHPNLTANVPELADLDNQRRESCKRHKQMLQDLDDWVVKCIESQEITPFENVPDVKRDDIVCF